jgi:hypothetical protein
MRLAHILLAAICIVPLAINEYSVFSHSLAEHNMTHVKKSLYLASDVCTNPSIRSKLEGETECESNQRYTSVTPTERALLKSFNRYRLCGEGRCDSVLGRLGLIVTFGGVVTVTGWFFVLWKAYVEHYLGQMRLPNFKDHQA